MRFACRVYVNTRVIEYISNCNLSKLCKMRILASN